MKQPKSLAHLLHRVGTLFSFWIKTTTPQLSGSLTDSVQDAYVHSYTTYCLVDLYFEFCIFGTCNFETRFYEQAVTQRHADKYDNLKKKNVVRVHKQKNHVLFFLFFS